MARKSDNELARWVKPATDFEQDRYDWTCREISAAIKAWDFGDAAIKTYPKGSYPAYTNVRADSDVDIAVEMTSNLGLEFTHGASGLTMRDFGVLPYSGSYDWRDLKNDVEAALVDRFGRDAVDRGNIAVKVRESRRGLAADVVPCRSHRAYFTTRGAFHEGTQLLPDRWQDIQNYPKQHIEQGKAKNRPFATAQRYKPTVRILKWLENEMVEDQVIEPVASFLIESLVWNVPNPVFLQTNGWSQRVASVLGWIYNDADPEECLEANGVKFLFHQDQPWSLDDARNFAYAAWNYLELS